MKDVFLRLALRFSLTPLMSPVPPAPRDHYDKLSPINELDRHTTNKKLFKRIHRRATTMKAMNHILPNVGITEDADTFQEKDRWMMFVDEGMHLLSKHIRSSNERISLQVGRENLQDGNANANQGFGQR